MEEESGVSELSWRMAVATLSSSQLVEACRKGDLLQVQMLLRQRADPNSSMEGVDALSAALTSRHVNVVRFLLKSRASIATVSSVSQANSFPSDASSAPWASPLQLAARNGPSGVVRLLIDASADVGAAGSKGVLPCEEAGYWGYFRRITSDGRLARKLLRTALLATAPCSGWLIKIGGKRRSWRRRFCVLTSDQLRYFADERLRRLRGHVDLQAPPAT